MSNKKIFLGTDDFKELIESNSLYIDKTLLIKELIDNPSKCVCFPRPRRFGKSLNMSMINYYFNLNYKDNKLFKGLNISKYGNKYKEEMNKYPLIFLSFKELKGNNYSEFINEYKKMIWQLYENYLFLLDSDKISQPYKDLFKEYYYKKNENLASAISDLMIMLKSYYNQEVIVILDEYDAPVLYAYQEGYYDKMIDFMKKLFGITFKSNINLKRGIVTGVLRLAIEDLGSGANNFKVYNITEPRYSKYFGFTEEEVKKILKEYNLYDNFNDVKKWYDGYLFGDTTIYNPISILNYLEGEIHIFQSYWSETGGVNLLKKIVFRMNDYSNILNEFHTLLENNELAHIALDLKMDLKNLKGNSSTIWTLFMLNGYLTPSELVTNFNDVTLKIPNSEIRESLKNLAANWLTDIGVSINFAEILKVGDIDKFKNSFESIVRSGFSYYDVPKNQKGENFYHGFVMGLLYDSTNRVFSITSNRESGEGRYDLVLKPINNSCNNAYIIELKSAYKLGFNKTIENCFSQIEEKGYIESVKEYNVTKIAIAYIGKKIKIETRKV